MHDKKNALAELAEREWSEADKDKARRIVAELAKVEYVYNPSTGEPVALPGDASNAVVKSRAIAEGGES